MKLTTAAKIRKQEDRKSKLAAERWQKWIANLRRRQMQQQERDRRRRWLLVLLLALLESKPAQMFFPVHFAASHPAQQRRQPQRSRKSEKKAPAAETRSDDERRHLYDYAPRHGEGHLEVYDGLTWADIIAYNRIHRPWLFPKYVPIPGMPSRYADEPVNVWTLLDHIDSDYHRPQALEALKLIVDSSAHDWINACATEVGDLTYKDLRRQCRRSTPYRTLYEFPRAAARWREDQRREAEERKREVKEMPSSGRKPPGTD